MNTNNDRCTQLRRLHERLIQEIQQLQASVDEEDREGVGNPLATLNVIKSLQSALQTIDLELQKCP